MFPYFVNFGSLITTRPIRLWCSPCCLPTIDLRRSRYSIGSDLRPDLIVTHRCPPTPTCDFNWDHDYREFCTSQVERPDSWCAEYIPCIEPCSRSLDGRASDTFHPAHTTKQDLQVLLWRLPRWSQNWWWPYKEWHAPGDVTGCHQQCDREGEGLLVTNWTTGLGE